MERSLELFQSLFSEQIFLPISIEDRQKAWKLNQDYSCNSARWTAFINQLMFNKTKEWLLSLNLPEKAKISIRKNLPSIWEFVTGTPIELDEVKIILIPNESTDNSIFYVPAEWVDIPGFTADYYLAAQVILAEEDDEEEYSHLRISGYTTWKDLKHGDYDELTRTYSLEREDLSEDVEYFLTHKEARTKQNVDEKALPNLSAPLLTDPLVEEVSKPSLYSPRYKLPLNQWLPLIGDDQTRQQIYETRTSESRKQRLSLVLKKQAIKIFNNLSALSTNLQDLTVNAFSYYMGTENLKFANLKFAPAARFAGDSNPRENQLVEIINEAEKNLQQHEQILHTTKLELAKIAPDNPQAAKIKCNKQFYLGEENLNLIIAFIDSTNQPADIDILISVTAVDEESQFPSDLTLSLLDDQENLIEDYDKIKVNPDKFLELEASPGEVFYIQLELNNESFLEKVEVC